MRKNKELFLFMLFLCCVATAGFSSSNAIQPQSAVAASSSKYYVGKITILNASKNEVTIFDYNANEERTFVVLGNIPGNLSLGEEVVIAADSNTGIAKSIRILASERQGLPGQAMPLAGQTVRHRPVALHNDFLDPFQEMRAVQERMQDLFDESLAAGFGQAPGKAGLDENAFFDPRADLKETDKAYVLQMDLPGMDKDSINVEIKNGLLIVSGERNSVIEENKPNQMHREERNFGHFLRSWSLPKNAETQKFDVQYEKGVLKVTIPKKTK
ncbi:MAG: Hsp20/alpha crystallin family protein [Candidatus Omnitrophica bacterium]|nr:Hsp20/alpha crystallin family protein [Candidatus Omnitrophota bacterium]